MRSRPTRSRSAESCRTCAGSDIRVPESNRALSPAAAVLLSLAASFFLLLGLSLVHRLLPVGSAVLSVAALIELFVYVGACFIIRSYLGQPAHRAGEWGIVMPPWGALAIALLLGFSLHGPADFIQAHIEQIFPLPEALREARAAGLSPNTPRERLLLFFAAAILVPIAEEAFFRGALFVGVSRFGGGRQAILVTAVCFTLSHAEPRLWPALSLVAIVISEIRQRTGSIFPSILLHAAFNATTLIVTFSYPEALREPASPSFLWAIVGTALSIGLLLLLHRIPTASRELR